MKRVLHLCGSLFSDINSVIARSQMSAHRDQDGKRRQVLEPVVDVVKVLSRRSLIYRQVENEAAYALDNNRS